MSFPNQPDNAVTGSSISSITAQVRDLQEQVNAYKVTRSPALSFPALNLLLILGLAGLLLYFIIDQANNLASLKNSLRQELVGEIQKTLASVIPPEITQRFTQKLDYLELRQTAILDEARNSIQRQSLVFTTVAAFFGLFTLFLVIGNSSSNPRVPTHAKSTTRKCETSLDPFRIISLRLVP